MPPVHHGPRGAATEPGLQRHWRLCQAGGIQGRDESNHQDPQGTVFRQGQAGPISSWGPTALSPDGTQGLLAASCGAG